MSLLFCGIYELNIVSGLLDMMSLAIINVLFNEENAFILA